MSRRSYTHSNKWNDDNKNRLNNKRSDRSRSPPSSYGITNESYRDKKQLSSSSSSSSYGITSESFRNKKQLSSKSNGFIPDEETKKFYEKSSDNDTGFWTTEDYTFRDMLAKDVRHEIEDDIASKGSDEESEEDPEIAEYADRADMDDEDDEQKKTMIERIIPIKKDEEKKKDIKSEQNLPTKQISSSTK